MPGSSNIQLWNPTQANQESDATYLADSTRAGGAGTGAIFASALANKLFYQLAAFVWALAGALADKGYVISDANPTTLRGVLANVITSADINGNLVTVSYAPSVTFNCTTNNGFQILLTGNVTASAFSGMAVGQEITVGILMDGSGNRTFVWPVGVNNAGTPDPTPNAMSMQRFKKWADGTIRAITPMVVG